MPLMTMIFLEEGGVEGVVEKGDREAPKPGRLLRVQNLPWAQEGGSWRKEGSGEEEEGVEGGLLLREVMVREGVGGGEGGGEGEGERGRRGRKVKRGLLCEGGRGTGVEAGTGRGGSTGSGWGRSGKRPTGTVERYSEVGWAGG